MHRSMAGFLRRGRAIAFASCGGLRQYTAGYVYQGGKRVPAGAAVRGAGLMRRCYTAGYVYQGGKRVPAGAAARPRRQPIKEESSLRRGARFGGRSLLAAVALAAAGGAVVVSRDEQLQKGLKRGSTFWLGAFPMYLHYRYVQWTFRNKDVDTPGPDKDAHDAAFNALHDKYAPVAERLCLQLRGFYLKHAQLCSTLDYFVPPQYMVWCKKMQDEVPTAFAPGQARAVVVASLGLERIEDAFEEPVVIPQQRTFFQI